MSSSHLILCHPLLLLPSIFQAPFNLQGLFQRVGPSHRWPKYWSFSLGISPSSEYSGLISFRIDWFDLFAVQGTLKSFLQHHSSKHQFFGAQPSLWCSTLCDPVDCYQASPSMGFSRQEYWSRLPFPSPGDPPHPGTEPGSPAL